MSDREPTNKSWIMEHGFVILNAASILVMVTIYISTSHLQTSQAATDLVTVNARLDRLFDKLDQINSALPVLAEKVRSAEDQITAGRGAYATLDVRLSRIEANNEPNHADIQAIKPNPRHADPR